MSFPNFHVGPNGEQFNSYSTIRGFRLGDVLKLRDGREFRFAENGAVATVAGKLYQSPVPGTNLDELAVAAAAAEGATSISVTLGTTALSKDDLLDGFVNIEDDAGEGRAYLLASHAAAATGANVTINLAPGDHIREALTTSTTVGIWQNPYKDIIVHPSPATAKLVGWAVSDIAANEFGWIQVKGPVSALTDSTVVINEWVEDSASVDGAAAASSSADARTHQVGIVMEVAADTEYSFVYAAVPGA